MIGLATLLHIHMGKTIYMYIYIYECVCVCMYIYNRHIYVYIYIYGVSILWLISVYVSMFASISTVIFTCIIIYLCIGMSLCKNNWLVVESQSVGDHVPIC